MATIYKRSRNKHDRRESWYIGYTDHSGKRRTVKGFTDRAETERLAARLEDETRQIVLGLKSPDDVATASGKRRAVQELLGEYRAHLVSRDCAPKYVHGTIAHIARMVAACQFRAPLDITSARVEQFLNQLRESGRSKQTSNDALKSMKQFCGWMVRNRHLPQHPLLDLQGLNAKTDRRHARRALSTEELHRLVAAARTGVRVEGVCGPDRAMLYVLAAWTGYRKGEIGSLTLSSFDLANDPATVTVEATHSKRRRRDTQVLLPDVADLLVEWLRTKRDLTPQTILFPISGRAVGGTERKTGTMMRHDLGQARAAWIAEATSEEERRQRVESDFLAYKNAQGLYADFHSNRHTFITNLSRAGVSPKVTQELARHSDIRLTMGVYSHIDFADKLAALRSLPRPAQRTGSGSEAEPGSGRHFVAPNPTWATPLPATAALSQVADATALSSSSHRVASSDANTPEGDGIRGPHLWQVRLHRPTFFPFCVLCVFSWKDSSAKNAADAEGKPLCSPHFSASSALSACTGTGDKASPGGAAEIGNTARKHRQKRSEARNASAFRCLSLVLGRTWRVLL